MLLAIDWTINPIVFLEFFVVVAFGIGIKIVDWVVARQDRERERLSAENDRTSSSVN